MRMIKRILFSVTVVATAMVATGVSAQQGKGRGGFGGGGAVGGLTTIAANEAVQKDLGASADVSAKLVGLRDEYRALAQKEYQAAGINAQDFQNITPEQRQKMTAISTKLNEEFTPKIKEVVSADQFKRLKQIQIQVLGSTALTNADVAAALNLTDEQKKKISEVQAEFARKQRELFTGGGDAQERFGKMRELNTERDNKAMTALNAEQKEKLNTLKGNAFDVSQLGFGGGRRGKN